jgi:hypothetical protein
VAISCRGLAARLLGAVRGELGALACFVRLLTKLAGPANFAKCLQVLKKTAKFSKCMIHMNKGKSGHMVSIFELGDDLQFFERNFASNLEI